MPNLPSPVQSAFAVQDSASGKVDFLKFQGEKLVASALHDYGLGSDFQIVAQGDFGGSSAIDLVAQSQTTGKVDILFLDTNGNLTGSAMSTVALPHIVGEGGDLGAIAGQNGPTLVSQLADGTIDLLGLNSSAQLVASQTIAGTTGLPHAAAIAEGNANPPAFYSGGASNNDTIVTQLADGTVDLIGLSGTFGNVTYTSSEMLSSTSGHAAVGDVNPQTSNNFNLISQSGGLEGIQFITSTSDGHFGAYYIDSGFNDVANEGALYASTNYGLTLAGYHPVDAGQIAQELFPIV